MPTRSVFPIVVALIAAACTPISQPATGMPASTEPATSTAPASDPAMAPGDAATPGSASFPDATSFPDSTSLGWSFVVDGLRQPVDLQNAGDGRLFIVEQAGIIRLLIDNQLVDEPVLDIRQHVESRGNEQGLLGLAFHPDFARNGFFYVNYTDLDGDTVIASYRMESGSNQANPASELILLRIAQPYTNHNGGGLAFGPDGYLYVATGDGGSSGDPLNSGQRVDTLLGKLLRLDVDNGLPYAIPADNPFHNGDGLPEIWAYGLRNPWRFTFDRVSGNLYIADVGQNRWEEVDFLPAGSPGGANFGWNLREGSHEFAGSDGRQVIDPIAEYDHDSGCSITGGVVIRDPALPEWQGVYLFGDFCTGTIWGLLRNAQGIWESGWLFDTNYSIASFGEDFTGGVYLLDLQGAIYRLDQNS